MPGLRRSCFPVASLQRADRCERVVEHNRVRRHASLLSHLSKFLPGDAPHTAVLAEVHGAMVDERDAEALLESLHFSDQCIDGATGCTTGRFIHADEEELVVSQLAGRREGHLVCRPDIEKAIELCKQSVSIALGERPVGGEDP